MDTTTQGERPDGGVQMGLEVEEVGTWGVKTSRVSWSEAAVTVLKSGPSSAALEESRNKFFP